MKDEASGDSDRLDEAAGEGGYGAYAHDVDEDYDLLGNLDPVRDATLIRWIHEADEGERKRARLKRLRELAAPMARRRTRPLDFRHQRGASAPLAVRLPGWLDEQLRRAFNELQVSPSEGVRQILEEWCVLRMFSALEYRATEFQRLAAIRGGPDIVDWLVSSEPQDLADVVREQVLEYVELFRGRVEAELSASATNPNPRAPPAMRAR